MAPREPLVPQNHLTLANFGKGDDQKLRRYLLMLAAFLEGRSAHTKRAYRIGLKQFFDLFEWVCPEDVTVAHAAAFKKWLLERRKVSPATAQLRLSSVSSFFDFLCHPTSASSDPLLTSNPFRYLPRSDLKPNRYARSKAMDWDSFRRILDALPDTERGLRDRALLLFYAFTGRRRSEALGLRIRDLDLRARPRSYTVTVKGGRVLKFELPDICYDAIKAYWLAADRLHSMTPDAFVFSSTAEDRVNGPVDYRNAARILERAAKVAQVSMDGVHLHAIRHMAARDLDKAGVPLQDIQAFLGHASPATTQLYLDRLSGPALAHTDVLLRVREAAAAMAKRLVESESELEEEAG